MAVDPYESVATGPDSFGRKSRLITPGGSDIDPIPKAVICLAGGDITVVPVDNDDGVTIAFSGVSAGFVPPFRVRKVTAATGAIATIED